MDEDNLELDLSLILNGLDNIREYTDALRNMAAAVRQVRRAMGDAAKAQADFASVQTRVNQGSVASLPSSSSNGMVIPSVRAPRAPKMTPEMQALYSTRLNLPGGAAPLLGKTLDAAVGPAATRGILSGLAPLAAKMLPFVAAFTVAKSAIEGFTESARQSAEITNRITSAQATSGGTTADVARLGLMGGSAGAARSFQERVTTDPQAMTAAARVGIRNLKGQYGNLNWTEQYLKAIENTAAIADDRLRQRLALTLGIEQEVARYSLLSSETRRRLMAQASVTGAINDPRTQAQGAEFDAAQQQMTQSWENVKTAFGSIFSDDVTGFLNELADGANSLAKWFKGMRGNNRRYKTPLGALTFGLLGDPGYDAPVEQTRKSPMMSNTMALHANTEAMNRLNSNIGGGARTQESLSPIYGQKMHEAMVSGSLRFGALG